MTSVIQPLSGVLVLSMMAPAQTDRRDIRTVQFVRDANGAQRVWGY